MRALEVEPIVKDGGWVGEGHGSHRNSRKCDRIYIIFVPISFVCICVLVYFALQPTRATDEKAAAEETCDHSTNNIEEDRSDILAEAVISHGGPNSSPDVQHCIAADYSKTTAKMIFELPLAALIFDHRGEWKFEASDIIIVDNYAYVVCDNSWAITKLELPLRPFLEENLQIGNPSREEEESDYEALFHHDGVFYAVRESVKLKIPPSKKKSYHAVIEELNLNSNNYAVLNQCPCEFEFEGTSKGFEGAMALTSKTGDLFVLGLCEGNFCSEKRKGEKGNGRIILMKKTILGDKIGECLWKTVKLIQIPASADLGDYSALALAPDGRVAITSQEDSKVWFGRLLGIDSAGHLDAGLVAFDQSFGMTFSFPRSDSCFANYCNIEGISFLDNNMFIAVSDKMKKGGKQDYRCLGKDQSAHVFVLP